jgi:hypothetical protein
MLRAVAFLVASVIVMGVGILLVVVRINSGLVDSSIQSRDSGARSGDNPAIPRGVDTFSSGQAGATATAAFALVTAANQTARAALTPRAGATPQPGGVPVKVGQPIVVNGTSFTALFVADPEPPGFFSTAAGNRRVALDVTVTALSAPLTYSFSDFRLHASDGKDYTWAITNTSPKFESGSIAAGESHRGWISFQLPVGVAPETLIYQRPGQPGGVAIVDLR